MPARLPLPPMNTPKPRRRSLKSLLQLPPSFFANASGLTGAEADAVEDPADGRTATYDFTRTKVIPLDIIITIAELLCPADVLSFSLTVRTISRLCVAVVPRSHRSTTSPALSGTSSFPHCMPLSSLNQVKNATARF